MPETIVGRKVHRRSRNSLSTTIGRFHPPGLGHQLGFRKRYANKAAPAIEMPLPTAPGQQPRPAAGGERSATKRHVRVRGPVLVSLDSDASDDESTIEVGPITPAKRPASRPATSDNFFFSSNFRKGHHPAQVVQDSASVSASAACKRSSVTFNSDLDREHITFTPSEYDRRSHQDTGPACFSADQMRDIARALDDYKMSEMSVHAESLDHTTLYFIAKHDYKAAWHKSRFLF